MCCEAVSEKFSETQKIQQAEGTFMQFILNIMRFILKHKSNVKKKSPNLVFLA